MDGAGGRQARALRVTEHANAIRPPVVAQRRDLDRARTVLESWLRDRLPGGRDLSLSPVTQPTAAGVANETLLFDATWQEGGNQRRQGFVARVGSPPQMYLEADVGVHARIMEALADVPGVPIPT